MASSPSYTRTRRSTTAPVFRIPQQKRKTKLQKWRRAIGNWLNGLPVQECDEEFHLDTLGRAGAVESPVVSPKKDSLRTRLKNKKWVRRLRRQSGPQSTLPIMVTAESNVVEGKDLESDEMPCVEKEIEVKPMTPSNVVGREREPVRIIHLPPESTALTAAMASDRKKDDVRSNTVTNEVRTTKYTLWSFVPKNFFEQMRRVANVYFLFLIFLQCFPGISNYPPYLAALPIMMVLIATGIKDAIEDWKRHNQDNEVNYSVCYTLSRPNSLNTPYAQTRYLRMKATFMRFKHTGYIYMMSLLAKIKKKPLELNGKYRPLALLPEGAIGWKETYWRDIRVGDIVFLRNNEMLPADLMVLSSSEPEGVCFVETKNLDGETNLKAKSSPQETSWIQTPLDAFNIRSTLEVELPNSNLYSFHGNLILHKKDTISPMIDTDKALLEDAVGLSEVEVIEAKGMELIEEPPQPATILPINYDSILLRGCILRNTEWVIGVVVYTGPDTKIMLNSGLTPSKRTRIERQLNPQVIINFLLLFIICISCAIVQTQFSSGSYSAPYWVSNFQEGGMYSSDVFLGFLTFWSSMILFQTLVPISMYITVEIVKTAQLYYWEMDKRAIPRSWNLADDLGQIEYLFSDKTGTLTQNVMEFKRCSIGGKVYGYLPKVTSQIPERIGLSRSKSQMSAKNNFRLPEKLSTELWDEMEQKMIRKIQDILPYNYVPPTQMPFVDPALFEDLLNDPQQSVEIELFFLLLSVCHTVLVDRKTIEDLHTPLSGKSVASFAEDLKPQNLVYQAQSPDEAALVAGARNLGFVFMERDKDFILVNIMGNIERIAILNIIEFNSDRKRMSAIVRREDGELLLLCKGADTVIFERLSPDSMDNVCTKACSNHLELFAEDGLRTLCLAYKRLDPREYQAWSARWNDASLAMNNRELLMDAVADEIERDLTLIGATAIEDKLQEGVAECISTLPKAGIKIWVLTGDKMETAINIGFSCRLLHNKMILLVIKGEDVLETEKQLKSAYERIWSRHFAFGDASNWEFEGKDITFAMIIEGRTLKHALDMKCRKLFIYLASQCEAVICCRVSPLQKAQVVQLMKRGKNAMTMAIGDGANDVSMIQAADVGVGIAGLEGMQAVMSSDYAICQFRFLTRLLLVHGRWAYLRVAKVTLLSLYKNLAFVVLLFWYQFYCGFTAQYVYDYMFLVFFNMLFCTIPLFFLGFFERDLPDKCLLRVPPIYSRGIKQYSYSMKLFLRRAIDAFYQSLVCFFIPLFTYQNTAVTWSGIPESQATVGVVMAIAIITVTNLYVAMSCQSWTLFFFLSLMASIGILFSMTVIYAFMSPNVTSLNYIFRIFMDPIFWFCLALCIVVSLAPRYILKYVQSTWKPNDLDIVREINKWSINEGALYRSLDPTTAHDRHLSGSLEDLSASLGDDILPAPPKALLRPESSRLTMIESGDLQLVETLPPLNTANKRIEEAPSSALSRLGRSRMGSRILKRSLALFNLNTGRFERLAGFAFSQERGMAQIVQKEAMRASTQSPTSVIPPPPTSLTKG